MTKDYDADLIAQNLCDVSPDVEGTSAFSVKKNGIKSLMLWTARSLTTDEMILLCRKLAAAIRREIPERPDGWAARLLAGNEPAMVMSNYYIGWASASATGKVGAEWSYSCQAAEAKHARVTDPWRAARIFGSGSRSISRLQGGRSSLRARPNCSARFQQHVYSMAFNRRLGISERGVAFAV